MNSPIASIKTGRLTPSFLILGILALSWWFTISDWHAELFGLYSVSRMLWNLFLTAFGVSLVYILYGKKDTRYKALSVITAFATTGLCVLLLEIPVLFSDFDYRKLMDVGRTERALDLSTKVNKPDPVLIHIHWPNSSFSGEIVGNLVQLGIPDPHSYVVDVRYDRNGFRNDRDYLKADIAFIGDSFVEGAIIPLQQTLVKRIERRFAVATVNLGQISYGFKQELEVLERYALPLSPKLIVWVLFGGNDLRDVKQYERDLRNFGKPKSARTTSKRFFTRNFLISSSNLLSGAFRFRVGERALTQSGLYRRADGRIERVYFGQTLDPWTDHDWDVATDTLSEAKRLSSEQGAEFVVVYIPRKYVLYRNHIETDPDTNIAKWDVAPLADALADWCAKNDLHFIDTSPNLTASISKGIHPYFVDDVHWNSTGHEIAADTLSEYFDRSRLFPLDSKNSAF